MYFTGPSAVRAATTVSKAGRMKVGPLTLHTVVDTNRVVEEHTAIRKLYRGCTATKLDKPWKLGEAAPCSLPNLSKVVEKVTISGVMCVIEAIAPRALSILSAKLISK